MNPTEIIQRVQKATSVGQLAELLNQIKRDEFGSNRREISEKQLKFFASDRIAPKRYRTFHIKKKSGGLREIKAPSYQLAMLLHTVNVLLKALYEPSDAAMGFAPGRSVVDNAKLHVGHNYVFNIDLKDFFPSIPQARVWKRLQLAPFNFSQEIANVLAGICCSRDSERGVNVLPQGAATSPLLTNAICDTLDRRLKGVAKRFGLHYSRYADDMTFSSMHNVYQPDGDFRTELRRIIEGQGFTINDAKTRLQKAGARQEVTGLTVNAVANVTRKYIKDLRWALHVWEKFGYAKAYALFYPKYKREKGHIKKGEPVMENVIGGKLNYLRMVKGPNNDAYKKLAARYDALQQVVIPEPGDKAASFAYVQSYKMEEFQELFHTAVRLELSPKGKLVGKCAIDGQEKTLSVSKSTQKSLLAKNQADAALQRCYVTLCQSKGKHFWIITKESLKRSSCFSIQDAKLNIDELLSIWENDGFNAAAEALKNFPDYGELIPSLSSDEKPLALNANVATKTIIKTLVPNVVIESFPQNFSPNDNVKVIGTIRLSD